MSLPQLLSIVESLGEFTHLREQLPGPGARTHVGGLHGSSDAVLLAALARNLPARIFIVVSDDVAGAERWLADLSTLVEESVVSFYPPPESFSESQSHALFPGQQVEAIQRVNGG